MYKNIVVGTDGSETASIALQHAIDLARLSGATVHVVHAFRSVSPARIAETAAVGIPAVDYSSVNEGIQQHASAVCAQAVAQAESADVTCEPHVADSDPADALIDVATKVGADLIVVGSRGMTGARRMLGSVPNKVSHHAPCNLLIVDTAQH
jgi:nucleotide-binding universal stress UspA family protein